VKAAWRGQTFEFWANYDSNATALAKAGVFHRVTTFGCASVPWCVSSVGIGGRDASGPCEFVSDDGIISSDDLPDFGRAAPPHSDPYADDDNDGLTNSVKTNTGVYASRSDTRTDRLNPDSDGDGVTDGQEVLFGSDPTNLADIQTVSATDYRTAWLC